ncbi:MAG: 2-keto-4-pentenoate hydratase [Clostridiales bacterium]|jgi:2-keto-4-pentenoate hydratase|nr:2-keto-4-pentenoate hydratase [Clostridiales bacterium]
MDIKNIKRLADDLYNSERARKSISPLTDSFHLTVDDAYHIQLENVKRVLGMGYKISGKKIGLTSPGIQRQLGVNEPDYGHLFDAMDCKDGTIRIDELMQPKIEAELAFILKADLSGGKITESDVIQATDYVIGAFEIVDSRIADWKIKLMDTIADNASSGRYILGLRSISPDADLSSIKMTLTKNGEKAGEGYGAAVLGDPRKAVAWLANKMWGYGVTLKAGEVILSGAFTAAPLAVKGDVFEADFDGIETVTAHFI